MDFIDGLNISDRLREFLHNFESMISFYTSIFLDRDRINANKTYIDRVFRLLSIDKSTSDITSVEEKESVDVLDGPTWKIRFEGLKELGFTYYKIYLMLYILRCEFTDRIYILLNNFIFTKESNLYLLTLIEYNIYKMNEDNKNIITKLHKLMHDDLDKMNSDVLSIIDLLDL